MEVLKFPDPKLKLISEPVRQFDKPLHDLLDKMAETMYRSRGVGLAAPQVGISKRIFVIDLGEQEDHPGKLYEFINPKITKAEGKISFNEGCLSIPGFTAEVTRKNSVTLQYQDRNGADQELKAEGFLAVALQHENDHLDGVLFIDRLSPLKRKLIRRKIEKAIQMGEFEHREGDAAGL